MTYDEQFNADYAALAKEVYAKYLPEGETVARRAVIEINELNKELEYVSTLLRTACEVLVLSDPESAELFDKIQEYLHPVDKKED